MTDVRHRKAIKTALPRTGKVLDAVGGGSASSGGGVSGGGSTPPVEVNVGIAQGEGIAVKKDQTGDAFLYTISHGSTSEGESSANGGTFIVKNVLVDKFGHVTGVESEDMSITFDGKYLRKDKPDETDYLLGCNGGATFGPYTGGFFGTGARINEKGEIEARSCKLWEFLETPELRFNRIDVISGEMWNAIAFGLIESVDEANRIVTLKLEKGELSGMHLSDFCRGIFHNMTDNATTPGKDSAGFDVMVGFSTAYFTPVEIIDNAHFKYELKPGTTVHPCQSMKFAVYGNPIEKNRQASAYSTRSYQRYLINVDTWEINPGKHVSMQLGDLSNLVINGESLAQGSVYLNNVYFGGNIRTVSGLDNGLKGKDAYSVTLSTYSAVYNTKDQMTEQLSVVTGDSTVTTGSDFVVASNFRISTRIQATKGETPLRYSTIVGEGKYLVSASGSGCTFTVTDGMIVVHEVSAEKATIKIEVNCEGVAVYEQEFTIVSVTDGIDGTDIEWIYKRTATEVKPAKPLSENTDDFVPKDWTDDPVGTTIGIPYEWSCKREKKNGVWGEFSEVFLWLKFGKDGKETEYIYKRTYNGLRPSTPQDISQQDDFVPNGWTDDPVGPDASYPYEWVSTRKKVNNAWGSFTLPALSAKYSFDGTNGSDGRPGTDGRPGSDGKDGIQGPGLNYVGDWSSTTTYYRSNNLVDIVSVRDSSNNPTYYLLKVSSSRNQYPGSYPSVWEVQNSFKNIATDLLFAKEATIARWTYSNYYIYSNNLSVCLNGQEQSNIPMLAVGVNGGVDSRGLIPDSSSPGGYKVNPNAALKIYRSGILTVGEGTAESNAGISGVGSPAASPAPVRFWAGTTYANCQNAPFRVDHYGNMVANNCNLTGSFQTASSGTRINISTESTGKLFRVFNSSGQAVFNMGYDSSNNYSFINLGRAANSALSSGISITTAGMTHYNSSGLQFSTEQNPYNSSQLLVMMKALPTSSPGAGYLYREGNFVKIGT